MAQFPIDEWQAAAREVEQTFYPKTGKSPLAVNPMAELDPELAALRQVVNRGRHYADPTMDLKTRALCTVACLVGVGAPDFAQVWMGNALTAGATRDEIVALLAQLSPYIGTPTLMLGYAAAKAAFEQSGV